LYYKKQHHPLLSH